ncbi:hypothetical protein BC827DRAFT_4394 [Russula dissimulans]|nr:hypothetical protein BC827DRAFT_4394 [Russula dissimulans]
MHCIRTFASLGHPHAAHMPHACLAWPTAPACAPNTPAAFPHAHLVGLPSPLPLFRRLPATTISPLFSCPTVRLRPPATSEMGMNVRSMTQRGRGRRKAKSLPTARTRTRCERCVSDLDEVPPPLVPRRQYRQHLSAPCGSKIMLKLPTQIQKPPCTPHVVHKGKGLDTDTESEDDDKDDHSHGGDGKRAHVRPCSRAPLGPLTFRLQPRPQRRQQRRKWPWPRRWYAAATTRDGTARLPTYLPVSVSMHR